MFLNRENEGFFEVLVNRHLTNNDIKFRQFLRVNSEQFIFLLSLVKNELTVLQLFNFIIFTKYITFTYSVTIISNLYEF